MKDLYTGLIQSKIKPGQNKYWGQYENINREIPTDEMLLDIQVKKLRNIEKYSNRYLATREFLRTASINLVNQEKSTEMIASQLSGRLIQLFNTALWGNISQNPIRQSYEGLIKKAEGYKQAQKNYEELTVLLQQLQVNQSLKEDILINIEDRIKKQRGSNSQYTQQKADYAEKLMVDALNKNPNWVTFQTGKLLDPIGKSIIEDSLTFNKSSFVTPFENPMYFDIIVENQKSRRQTSSAQDFFKQIQNLNGNYSIELTDKLYGALKKAAIISGQAKSGVRQPILTQAARNQISLKETGFSPEALFHLYQLQSSSTQWFKNKEAQNSFDLEALANYSLSTAIGKTAITANQIYYTEDGFVKASDWIEKYRQILKFSPGVKSIDSEFLSKKRHYQLMKI